MRRVTTVVMLAACGCGRVGFEATRDGDASEWWDRAWGVRREITVDSGRVMADLADFPLLVVINDDFAAARADGSDLAFVAGGQQIPHELERFDQAAGKLSAWIKVSTLSSTVDTTFHLYYGNPAPPSPPDARTVWSADFVGVYHFGNGPTVSSADATGVNDATANGAIAAQGRVLNAARFAGVTPTFSAQTVGIDTSPGGLNTVSFWLNISPPFGTGPVAFDNGATVYDLWFERDGCFGFNTENGEVLGTTMQPLHSRWIHVAAVFYNGVPSATSNELYIDGMRQPLSACAPGAANARTVGGRVDWGGNPTYEITGLIDEARIARVRRSPEWIYTEKRNVEVADFAVAGPAQAP